MLIAGLSFYILAAVIIVFSLAVLMAKNPIYSALFLAVTMVTMSFVFFSLQAYFIAGVQLIVYAGAVMVLFTMVLMLFDLKKENNAFTRGKLSSFLKIASGALLAGIIVGGAKRTLPVVSMPQVSPQQELAGQMTKTLELSRLLFTDYLFAFEALGLLLLLIAIGAVAMSRMKGGTHAKS